LVLRSVSEIWVFMDKPYRDNVGAALYAKDVCRFMAKPLCYHPEKLYGKLYIKWKCSGLSKLIAVVQYYCAESAPTGTGKIDQSNC